MATIKYQTCDLCKNRRDGSLLHVIENADICIGCMKTIAAFWLDGKLKMDCGFAVDKFGVCVACKGEGTTKEWTGIGSDYNDETCKQCRGQGSFFGNKSP